MEGTAAPVLAIEPLEERESIEQRVAQALRAPIVSGQLPEGTQLVQRDLAARLGVSQTPVRAGIAALQREGFALPKLAVGQQINELAVDPFQQQRMQRFLQS